MSERPEFGKTYTILAKFVKGRHTRGDYGGPEWEREELPVPVKALYVGYRYVSDGDLKAGFDYDYGDYQYFKPTKRYFVYQFILNERTNLIHVLPGDVANGAQKTEV
jgi:hypothetical protein